MNFYQYFTSIRMQIIMSLVIMILFYIQHLNIVCNLCVSVAGVYNGATRDTS